MKKNLDKTTITSFGEEWQRFDQSQLNEKEGCKIFNEYFTIFPWDKVNKDSVGFDMGCGTGRGAKYFAPKVGQLSCIDPSKALDIAKDNLSNISNISFISATVDEDYLPLNSQDFGYSLGVLHHIPDTSSAIKGCVKVLKSGAPLLLYLYYAFDNRPFYFKLIWKISNLIRLVVSQLPDMMKNLLTDVFAYTLYYPLSKMSLFFEKLGFNVSSFPLSYYRNHSLYTMRTDSRDRFGTPMEHRFTKKRIEKMMKDADLHNIRFSESAPYWCVVGEKK